jgi:hypothetical protein
MNPNCMMKGLSPLIEPFEIDRPEKPGAAVPTQPDTGTTRPRPTGEAEALHAARTSPRLPRPSSLRAPVLQILAQKQKHLLSFVNILFFKLPDGLAVV